MQTLRDIAHKRIWASQEKKQGIGTFTGVFLPSFITMTGALLFLNLGFLVGSEGVFTVVAALFLGLLITLFTALSVTAMASNTKIGRGGMYYMLSRCFGYEIGASAGVALYIAHTLMASLCIMGLSSSISMFLPNIDPLAIRWGMLSFVTLTAFTSTKLALRLQIVIFIAILATLAFFIVGPFQTITTTSTTETVPTGFWYIFALLYPSLIGIEAGSAMSSELKRPRFGLIIGTLSVTLAGFFFYLCITFILWKVVPRETLLSTKNILQFLSPLGPFALMGLFGSTLFSAMGCLLTAPNTLTAMAEDRLFPKLFRNLRASTILTAIFVAIGISIGSMGGVVPVLTKVILIVYGMLNLAVAVEQLVGSPSWRPSVYVWPLAPVLGAFFCFFSMFMMDAGEAFFACGLTIFIAVLVRKWKSVSKWNDLKQTILFSISRYAIYKLNGEEQTHRSWRPNFLVLSESASLKSPLLGVANQLSNGQGILTLASIFKEGNAQFEDVDKWERVIRANLKKRRIEALVEVSIAENLLEGLRNIITHFGVKPLNPNTVVLGESVREDHFANYLQLIEITSEAKLNLLILRGDLQKVGQKRDDIDIWYNPKEKKSCELMILLAHTLKKSKLWRGANITLKSIVKSTAEKESKEEYFEQYFNECRLSMQSEIYVYEGDDPVTEINRLSTKQGIVFYAMKEPDENLATYYKATTQKLKDIPTLCLTLCREDIELKMILQ